MVPPKPTVTKILFPWVTLLRVFDVPEVLDVHVVPLSDEVRMVPPLPTATYNTLVVVVVELLDDSSFSAHEINEAKKMNNPMNRYNLLYIEASYRY